MAGRLALASALIALAACGSGDPYFSTYTRKQPMLPDVVGTYAPAPPGRARVELKADGAFQAVGLDVDAGAWSIVRHQEWWAVQLKSGARSTEIYLRGGSPPYRLHRTIGDPDSGDALVFDRVP